MTLPHALSLESTKNYTGESTGDGPGLRSRSPVPKKRDHLGPGFLEQDNKETTWDWGFWSRSKKRPPGTGVFGRPRTGVFDRTAEADRDTVTILERLSFFFLSKKENLHCRPQVVECGHDFPPLTKDSQFQEILRSVTEL